MSDAHLVGSIDSDSVERILRGAAARKRRRIDGVATACGIARAAMPAFVQNMLRLYTGAAAHLRRA